MKKIIINKKEYLLTDDICNEWIKNKNKNPYTKYKITDKSPIYKKFEKNCKKEEKKDKKEEKKDKKEEKKDKKEEKKDKKEEKKDKKEYLITYDICNKWFLNKYKNPYTNYKITDKSPIYKLLDKNCKKEIIKKTEKKFIYIDIDKLISSLNDELDINNIYLKIQILINNINIKVDNIEKSSISSKTNTNTIKILLREINDKFIKLKNIKEKIDKEKILEILLLIKEVNNKIYYKIYKKKFLNKLEKARENVKKSKDIYMNEEHKEMCYLYKTNIGAYLKNEKYRNIKIFYYYNNIFINYNKYIIKNNNINKINKEKKQTIYSNNFNLKIIEKLNLIINQDILNKFIKQQQDFFETLSIRELYNLKYYTSTGYELLNSYLKGKFNKNKKYDIYIYGINNNFSDNYLLFYYQFLDIFHDIYNNKQQDKYNFLSKTNFDFNKMNDKEYFNNYIYKNFKYIDNKIFEKIFKNYINEMIDIFNKAPIVEDDIICYRGIKENHINENKDLISLKKGIYINNSFMSTSLFIDTAINFASNPDIEKRYIQRINIKNNRVIFLQLVSSYEHEYEILLPINSRLYIEYPFREMRIINIFNQMLSSFKCEEEMVKFKVMDNILKNPKKY